MVRLALGECEWRDLGKAIEIGFDLGPLPDMRQNAERS
jgi:hypothetical protein